MGFGSDVWIYSSDRKGARTVVPVNARRDDALQAAIALRDALAASLGIDAESFVIDVPFPESARAAFYVTHELLEIGTKAQRRACRDAVKLWANRYRATLCARSDLGGDL